MDTKTNLTQQTETMFAADFKILSPKLVQTNKLSSKTPPAHTNPNKPMSIPKAKSRKKPKSDKKFVP